MVPLALDWFSRVYRLHPSMVLAAFGALHQGELSDRWFRAGPSAGPLREPAHGARVLLLISARHPDVRYPRQAPGVAVIPASHGERTAARRAPWLDLSMDGSL